VVFLALSHDKSVSPEELFLKMLLFLDLNEKVERFLYGADSFFIHILGLLFVSPSRPDPFNRNLGVP